MTSVPETEPSIHRTTVPEPCWTGAGGHRVLNSLVVVQIAVFRFAFKAAPGPEGRRSQT